MKRSDFWNHWFNWYAVASALWAFGVLFNEFINWRAWNAQDWAAWFGALGTFLAFGGTIYLANFETRRREAEAIEAEIGAGNRAIFTIFGMWNTLEQYRKEVLEPYRGQHDAWLNVAANPAMAMSEYKFETRDLQFLLRGHNAETFASLFLEEQRFVLAAQLIRARSELILNDAWKKMAMAGQKLGAQLNEDELEELLGIDLTHKLKQLTAAIYKNIDEDLASLVAAHDAVRSAMQALYPDRTILKIMFSSQP